MKILVRGARLVDPAEQLPADADVLIDGHMLAAVEPGIEDDDAEVVDARGCWLVPGLVDLSARVAGDGHQRELAAGLAGGVTSVCLPPDGAGVLDDATDVRDLLERCGRSGGPRVLPIGALTRGLAGEALSDMAGLLAAGCVGVGNGHRWVADSRVMRCAMQYAAELGLTVFIRPSDPWLSEGGCAHAGRMATRLGLPGIPAVAETAALARDLALVEDTGVRAHFGPLSSAASVALIEAAVARGLPVTADTAIHHLFLTEMDLAGYNAACRVQPPLRTQEDRAALRRAVANGLLLLCSDHTPLPSDAKTAPFPGTEPGISGIETLLGLGLRLVQEELLTPPALLRALASGPAAVIGRAAPFTTGQPADLVLVDPDDVVPVEPGGNRWHSNGRNTPFSGWQLEGVVRRVLGSVAQASGPAPAAE